MSGYAWTPVKTRTLAVELSFTDSTDAATMLRQLAEAIESRELSGGDRGSITDTFTARRAYYAVGEVNR